MIDLGRDKVGLERLILFSDAVFAVAITLLVLDIKLPSSLPPHASEVQIRDALIEIMPKYVGYVLSFLTVGLVWAGHHRNFRQIAAYDAVLLRLNFLFLMVVAFVPFVTSLVSEHRFKTTVVFYSATMMTMFLLSAAVWAWASRDRKLLEPDVSSDAVKLNLHEPMKIAGVFAVSMALAIWSVDIALWSLLLIIPARINIKNLRATYKS